MAGEYLATGGGRYLGINYVLLGGGKIGWFRVVVHVGGNDEDGVGNAYIIPS